MAITKINALQIKDATATVGLVDAHIKAGAEIAQSKIAGLVDALGTLQDNIDSEATLRDAAILVETTNRQNAISEEVTARNAAILVETTNRQNAISEEVTARDAAIAGEATARNAAILVETTNRQNAISEEVTARNAAILVETTNRQAAISGLQDAIIGIGTSTEWQASCNTFGITPPGSPATGYRVLIVEAIDVVTGGVTVGTPTGAFADKGGNIATFNGTTWSFTSVSAGTFTTVDDVPNGILAFVSSWSLKQFEATVAGDGVTKTGLSLSAKLHASGGLVIDGTSKGIKIDTSLFVAKTAVQVRDPFTGVLDGTNKAFTLSKVQVANSETIFMNGMLQNPVNDYTISGQVITFVEAPLADSVVVINFIEAA